MAISGELIRAAGAVLWRDGAAGIEVALIHRPKYDDWTFPKGKLDKREHVLRAVVREVEEETGITPRLGRPLSPQFYPADGRPKRVDYWAATVRKRRHEFVAGDEVDRMEWLTLSEAVRWLSYRRDVELLREFGAGPLRTTATVILRHASAGARRGWRDLDALRPLDPEGRADARELSALLSAYDPVKVISSATARCVETVLPYALAERLDVTTDLAFTIDETDLARARARMAEVISAAGPAVVCTHGEIVPALLTEVCERLGGGTPREPALRKGGFWILHLVADDAGAPAGIAAVEEHAPDH